MLNVKMKFFTLHGALLVGSLLLTGLCCQGALPSDEALPAASKVMQRVVERAHDATLARGANNYAFEKHSITEELDASGKATKTIDETYDVIPIEGIPFSRLVKMGNRDLTQEEIEAQNRKELEFRERVARTGAKPVGRRRRNWLDARMVDRFDFTMEGRETLHGRPVLMLSFLPKANHASTRTIEDRVLNKLAGTLWVDETEAEIAKLSVGLTTDLSFGFFGAVGSLKQFDLKLDRERLADGLWVTQRQDLVLGGRKVFSSMAHRTLEESTNFRKP
jgi:hypothetical protein